MKKGWITRQIEAASPAGFIFWFAVLVVYSFWAFAMNSPWTRAMEAAGGVLPETKPGIPAIEPVRTLQALGEATGDYIFWQLLDFPYVVMSFFAAVFGMGLGLKALRLAQSPLRYLLVLPVIYAVCELVENAFLASFAAGLVQPAEGVVLVQQFATTLKFASGVPASLLGVLGALIALAAFLFRKRP
ncbi:hypothetical protein [Hyphococcus luteus]|uniref:Uncharacterized protein n=1 Tax=Hyphococcus luteus TaxID=2058213 RepID=A0A2S7K5K4_9PROT|nr:hypothetical protein [Marinicaulis flavus]PQA87772.1 hypothetical protein CW354_05285 [Marinicaulis flavus]